MNFRRLILQTAVSLMAAGWLGAAALTPMQTSLVAQGTIPDGDFFFLTGFTSFQAGQTLRYVSSSDTQNWTASLSGTYGGNPLHVDYSGTLAGLPGSPIVWTSSGSYASEVWAGSGSMSITDQPGGFTVDFQSTLQVGANVGLVSAVIDATYDGSAISYGDTTGTMSINGTPLGMAFGYTLHMKISDGVYLNDFDLANPFLSSPPSPVLISIFPTFPNPSGGGLCSSDSCQIAGTLTTVPEPSSLALCGLLVFAGLGWKRSPK